MILWEELDSTVSRTTLRGIRFAGQVPKSRATDDDVPSAETRGKMQTYSGVSQGHRNYQFVERMAIPLKGYMLNIYAWSSMRQRGSRADRTYCKINWLWFNYQELLITKTVISGIEQKEI